MYQKALALAIRAHEGQFRKYSARPYIVHPIEVALKISQCPGGVPDYAICAAILHDVVEDSPHISQEEILEASSEQTLKIVLELSDNMPQPGLNRRQRKEKDLERLAASSCWARMIKAIDRQCNLADFDIEKDIGFAKLYLRESEDLHKCLVNSVWVGDIFHANSSVVLQLCSSLEDEIKKFRDKLVFCGVSSFV